MSNYKRIKSLILILFVSTLASFIPCNKVVFNSPIKEKIVKDFTKNQDSLSYKSNELIIRLENNNYEELEKKYNIDITSLGGNNYLVTYNEEEYQIKDILILLNKEEQVAYAEPNYAFTNQKSPTTEPDFNKQWGFSNPNYSINILDVWPRIVGKEPVVVAVLDMGINYNHPDLKNIVWKNTSEIPNNGIDDDNNGYVDDYQGWNFAENTNEIIDKDGHGSHISGIIAGEVNDIGITGVSPNIKIMALRVADDDGNYYISDVIAGIDYALNKGVKIFNFSFGNNSYLQSIRDKMAESNALFICAAGNGGTDQIGDNNDTLPFYPASYDLDNIISVASINSNGSLSLFSNYGQNSVDIAAPGNNIYSSSLGTGYMIMSGTSMATPFVTGVAAILHSENKNIDILTIKEKILEGAKKLVPLQTKMVSGGILDTKKSYDKIMVLLTFSSGNGTANDPYLIESFEQLNAIRYYPDLSYKLTSNIELSYDSTNSTGWVPIGTKNNPFTGILDGNGYTISNLTINKENDSYLGLFGYVNFENNDTPNIYDLKLETKEIIGKDYVGGLIGYGNNVYLKDIEVNSQVISTGDYVGGIIGYATNSKIENVKSSGNISSTKDYIGGISGYLEGNITKSYNTSNILGNNNMGGISGYLKGNVIDVFNLGIISEGSQNSNVGGIIGSLEGDLTNSYNIGTFDFITAGESIGFIVGLLDGNISNSYYYNPYNFVNNSYGDELTIEEIYDLESYIGFDFDSKWEVLENNLLPTLKDVNFEILTDFEINNSIKVILTNPKYSKIKITSTPNNSRYSYVYTSSDEEIIKVTKTGEIVPISLGTAKVTVLSLELNNSKEITIEVIEGIKGDLNGDFDVTLTDLVILRRYLAGLEDINNDVFLHNADVNNDNNVTLTDLVKLRRFLAGLEEL